VCDLLLQCFPTFVSFCQSKGGKALQKYSICFIRLRICFVRCVFLSNCIQFIQILSGVVEGIGVRDFTVTLFTTFCVQAFELGKVSDWRNSGYCYVQFAICYNPFCPNTYPKYRRMERQELTNWTLCIIIKSKKGKEERIWRG
jgi:hypothetical protein